MNPKILALRLSGTIFGVVSVLHLLRVITGVSVLIGGWELPTWVNWIGLMATGFPCG